VAQYLAVEYDGTRPKEFIRDILSDSQKPFDFNEQDEPLNVAQFCHEVEWTEASSS
jgi:hypothetical protein